METIIEKLKISLTNIHDTILSNILLWTIKPTKIILDLRKFIKTKIYMHKNNCLNILAGGYKGNGRIECSVFFFFIKTTAKKCLPKGRSIFSTKTCVVDLALNMITENKLVILLDSFSILLSLKNNIGKCLNLEIPG